MDELHVQLVLQKGSKTMMSLRANTPQRRSDKYRTSCRKIMKRAKVVREEGYLSLINQMLGYIDSIEDSLYPPLIFQVGRPRSTFWEKLKIFFGFYS